jgi:hypothetical protein
MTIKRDGRSVWKLNALEDEVLGSDSDGMGVKRELSEPSSAKTGVSESVVAHQVTVDSQPRGKPFDSVS